MRGITGSAFAIMSHRLLLTIFSVLLVVTGDSAAIRDHDTWILVDTRKMVLSVLEGNKIRRTYKKIAIGRAGTTKNKIQGDNKTPLGDFRLVRIKPSSSFHLFFGIDYPTVADARRAFRAGTISYEDYTAVFRAFKARGIPPQDSPLGGYIGIHGIGKGDTAVHENFNWTQGCIALTNQQIDDLSKWVYIGMRVVVR